MPRKKTQPWYKKSLELGIVFLGIIIVQVIFAKNVDKDEYQRIIGTSVVFAVREFLGRREQ